MNSKKKRYVLIMIAIGLILIFISCGKKEKEDVIVSSIYYMNFDDMGLVKCEYKMQKMPMDQMIDQVLKDLVDCKEKNLKSVYPENIKVEKWEYKDSDLLLYFPKSYSKMDADEELMLRAATVKTLCQVQGVDFVNFYVDGRELTDQDDRVIGSMNEEYFVGNVGSSLHSYKETSLKLFFTDEQGMNLIEKSVDLRYNSNSLLEKMIVAQLIKGPGDASLSPVIPPETKILGVSVQDGICYVNLDESFLNISLHVNPKIMVYSIVNSIIENGDVSKVQIMVNGESDMVFGDELDLTKPLTMDLELIKGGE